MRRRGVALALLLALAVCLMTGCALHTSVQATKVLVDGQAWDGAPIPGDDELRVYITLDGAALIDLPFGQAHTVEIQQADGSINTVRLTGDSVVMESANCDNQDCVQMGAVTRENLELRVMGGFIICLPHKLSVEVRGE